MLNYRDSTRFCTWNQSQQQAVPVDFRLVSHRLIEIQHQACAVFGLNNIGAFQITFVIGLTVLAETIDRVRKIKGNTCRLGHAEAGRQSVKRFLENQLHVEHTALLRDGHGFD